MSLPHIYPVSDAARQRTHLDDAAYQRLYRQSVDDPQTFWGEQAKAFLDWFKPWDEVLSGSLSKGDIRWFSGGQLNISHNCIDRHLAKRGDQVALIWEGDDPKDSALSLIHI